MKQSINPNAVGVDAFFREIFAGDTIQDLAGVRYTVDKQGICTPLAGGSIRRLSAVKEPAVVGSVAPPFAEGAGGKVGPAKPADETPAETRETPAPEKKKRGGSRGPKSDKTRIAMSKGSNKSGAVQIYQFIRRNGLMLSGTDCRRILEDAGIKTFGDSAGRGCIACEDYGRALEILTKWSEAHSDNPAWPATPEPESKPAPVTKSPDPVFPGGGDLAALTDQQLADELRARGYTLTATKTVTQTIEL